MQRNERQSAAYSWLAVAFLAFLFGDCVYRATTQSVTVDEAFVYSKFIHTGKLALFNLYDAGHHILYTDLCWLSTKLFGTSELTLRLPALLGALVFFTGILRLCRRAFGAGPAFLFSVVLLASNPLILDHLSIARGYGLALGLFVWSLHCSIRHLDNPSNLNALFGGGVLLGLSVAANLTFTIPGLGLVAVTLALGLARARHRREVRKLVDTAISQYLGPGLVTCSLLILLPLSRAGWDAFYYGTGTVSDSVKSLVQYSFQYKQSFSFLPALSLAIARFVNSTVFWVAPAMLLVIVIVCILAAGKPDGVCLLAPAGTLFVALGLLLTAHRILRMPYPEGRTGIYLIFLFPLAALAVWRWLLSRRAPARWLSVPWLAALALAASLFLLQFDTRYYGEWAFDSQTRTIIEMIRARPRDPGKPVRFGGSWGWAPSVNFYRELYRLDWMLPFEDGPNRPGLDYYLLAGGDAHVIDDLKLHELFRGSLCGCILAAPEQK